MSRIPLIYFIIAIIFAFFLLKRQEIISNNEVVHIEHNEKEDIIKRAKSINKSCYTNEDLEFIIFGEPQL